MACIQYLLGIIFWVLCTFCGSASSQSTVLLTGGEILSRGSTSWPSADGAFTMLIRKDGTLGIDWVACGNVPVWTLSTQATINQVTFAKEPFFLDDSYKFTFEKNASIQGGGGDLFLYNSANDVVWSTNTGGQAATATLQATGNFQLLDASGAAVWQSFNYPTDTLLPDQVLTNTQGKFGGLSAGQYRLFIQKDGTLVLYRAGMPCLGAQDSNLTLCSDGLYPYCSFSGDSWTCATPPYPTGQGPALNAVLSHVGGQIKLSTTLPGAPTNELLVVGNDPLPNIQSPMRLTLGTNGQLQLLQYQVQKKGPPIWQPMGDVVKDLCNAGPCGDFAACSNGTPSSFDCTCVRGFQSNPAGSGCVPWTPLICSGNNKFIDITGFRFKDGDVDISSSIQASFKACKDDCLRNAECGCIAVSYDVNQMCRLKNRLAPADLADPAEVMGANYSVRITELPPRPPPSPPPPAPTHPAAAPPVGALVGGVAGGIIGLLIMAVALYCYLRRQDGYRKGINKQGPREEDIFAPGPGAAIFTYDMLKDCTNDFSDSNRLGHGGFGLVFKGTLRNGTTVAIKSLGEKSRQGDNEFMAEANLLSRLQHPNLVRLQGWCSSGQRRLLVYEYMSGGSLDKLLFTLDKPPLTFAARWHIIKDVARALAYMHEGWERVVVHRDVKTSNILLDSRMNARLGDFGLARSGEKDKAYISTEYAAGTAGYAPPESQYGSQASPKWDVFSFGVVVLEMASGRRAVDTQRPQNEISLRLYAWQMHREGRLMELPDPRLERKFPQDRMIQLLSMGLLCTAVDPKERPTMMAVVNKFMGDKTIEAIKVPESAGPPVRDQTPKSLHGIIKASNPLGSSHSSPGKLGSVGSHGGAASRRNSGQATPPAPVQIQIPPLIPPSPPRPYYVQSPAHSVHSMRSPSPGHNLPSPHHMSQHTSPLHHSQSPPTRFSPSTIDHRTVYISNP